MPLQAAKSRKQPARRGGKAAVCKTRGTEQKPASTRELSPPRPAENSPEEDPVPEADQEAKPGPAACGAAKAQETAKAHARVPDVPAQSVRREQRREPPAATCRTEVQPGPRGGTDTALEKGGAPQPRKAPSKPKGRLPNAGAQQAPPPKPAQATSEDPPPAPPRAPKHDRIARQQENAASGRPKNLSPPPRSRREVSPEPSERVRCSAPSPEDVHALRARSPRAASRAADAQNVRRKEAEPVQGSGAITKEQRAKVARVLPSSRAGPPGGRGSESKPAGDPGEPCGRDPRAARHKQGDADQVENGKLKLTGSKARPPAVPDCARAQAREAGAAQPKRQASRDPRAAPAVGTSSRGAAQARQRNVQASGNLSLGQAREEGTKDKAAEEWEALDREELVVEAASPDFASLLAKLGAKVSAGKGNAFLFYSDHSWTSLTCSADPVCPVLMSATHAGSFVTCSQVLGTHVRVCPMCLAAH